MYPYLEPLPSISCLDVSYYEVPTVACSDVIANTSAGEVNYVMAHCGRDIVGGVGSGMYMCMKRGREEEEG